MKYAANSVSTCIIICTSSRYKQDYVPTKKVKFIKKNLIEKYVI